MKTKEYSKQVRNGIVKRFEAGLSYKTISQALIISQWSVQSTIWKENIMAVDSTKVNMNVGNTCCYV